MFRLFPQCYRPERNSGAPHSVQTHSTCVVNRYMGCQRSYIFWEVFGGGYLLNSTKSYKQFSNVWVTNQLKTVNKNEVGTSQVNKLNEWTKWTGETQVKPVSLGKPVFFPPSGQKIPVFFLPTYLYFGKLHIWGVVPRKKKNNGVLLDLLFWGVFHKGRPRVDPSSSNIHQWNLFQLLKDLLRKLRKLGSGSECWKTWTSRKYIWHDLLEKTELDRLIFLGRPLVDPCENSPK